MKTKVFYTVVYVTEAEIIKSKPKTVFELKDKFRCWNEWYKWTDIQLFDQNRSFLCIIQTFTVVDKWPTPLKFKMVNYTWQWKNCQLIFIFFS